MKTIMKKFLSILFLALTAVVGVYAQETSSKKNFAEVGGVMMQGLGEFDNFTYWGGGLSLGHYFTPIWGVSVEGKVVFRQDRKSTRLNSSHANISYAVFC